MLPSELLNPSRANLQAGRAPTTPTTLSEWKEFQIWLCCREGIIFEDLRSEFFLLPCKGSPSSGDLTSGEVNPVKQEDMARHHMCQCHEPISGPDSYTQRLWSSPALRTTFYGADNLVQIDSCFWWRLTGRSILKIQGFLEWQQNWKSEKSTVWGILFPTPTGVWPATTITHGSLTTKVFENPLTLQYSVLQCSYPRRNKPKP